MYAHEYGLRNFKHKSNFENLVVFSDSQQNLLEETALPSANIYLEIEEGVREDNKWFVHFNSRLSGEYGDFFLQNRDPYGEIESLQYLVEEENYEIVKDRILLSSNGRIPFYKINDRFYIKLSEAIDLEEVVITADIESGPQPKTQEVVSIELDSFVTLLISDNGAKLERAYQRITNVNAHEVVILIETDEGTNAFGTVFRIRKGKNVKTLPEVDRVSIAKVARAFGVEITTNDLSTMIKEELVDDDSTFYISITRALSFTGGVVRWASDGVFSTVSEELKNISKEINDLKLGDSYWKTEVDGKENPKFDPLLPKLKNDEEGIDTEAFVKSIYKTYIQPLTEKATEASKAVLKSKFVRKLIPFNVDKIIQVLDKIPELLQDFFDGIVESFVDLYYFINGLLVGLINSIIDFIKSLFDILAMLFDLINGIIQSTKFFESPGSYLSLFAENFENIIDTFANVFTFENLKKFNSLLISLPKLGYQAIVNIINNPIDVNIDPGAIGYYLGFIVGFIASEVVTFFATGGTGNIAKALKAVLQSYKAIATIPAKVAAGTAKIAGKAFSFGVDTFVRLIDVIVEFSKNIPKHLETLKGLLDEFVESLASITNKLFEGFEAVLDLLFDLGVVIIKGPDPKLALAPVNGPFYNINYNGKTIVQGPEDAIRKFAQRIDEIVKSGGNTKKKVKHYLDELAESLSVTHKGVLDKRGLKIIREKGSSANLSVLDKENDVVMKGKQDDIEKYLTKMRKSDKEIRKEFKDVLKVAVVSDSKRFDPLKKALSKFRAKGIKIKKSGLKGGVEKGRGLVPDFLHNPEFLFNSDKKFGKIKIKVTGVDSDDFRLCNEAVEKFMPGFTKKYVPNGKNKPNKYTWHHMDDYDPITGECTMQLVKTKIHTKCFPHKGAPGIIELFFGIARSK
ncbi:HNH endonuclease [Tenacibaculum sp. 190524A05c]|uniref:HNH/ENDO VII superfamily nuclease n=1 Tax=Tenacibaculum platacis TaxID=3137852 RepID=A0ABM9NUX8_9FLAO